MADLDALARALDAIGQKWHINVWTEIVYHLDEPEKVGP